jgi:predicted O-methyltransferase YrrM
MNILKKLLPKASVTAIATNPSIEIRPLLPVAGPAPITAITTPESIIEMQASAEYAKAKSYFSDYPARSMISDNSRAVLFSLIRTLRPQIVVEVGTLFAGTTEVMARALWENGEGILHTIDPYGADRCPAIFATWPQELRNVTRFHVLNSMDFFHWADSQRLTLDLVLVDGAHDYEFALFDLQMAARLLRPGGIVVMDNAEQIGPYKASRAFIDANPAWRELGQALASYDRADPFNLTRSSAFETSFVLLQAPTYFPVGEGPHSWGQMITTSCQLDGFILEPLPQATAGTLHYQAILRGFFRDGSIPEAKIVDSVRLDVEGPAKIAHEFKTPLRLAADAHHYTLEINLSWQADPGLSLLALAAVPAPL